ncbi:MAG: hypothetical protein ACYTEZ_10585 [Planctomycetota bacterium]|jgi:biopolymer transport protein ExbD
MRTPGWICGLALLAACGGEEERARLDLANVNLPVASQGVEDRDDDPDDRVVVGLDRHGVVWWQGRQVNLDELGFALYTSGDEYEHKMRREGETGLEALPGGHRASKLFVLLRADRDAVWQHVQWLLTIFAEQKLYKVQLGVKRSDGPPPATPRLEAKLDAFLPTDWGLIELPQDPPDELRIPIHIVVRQEVRVEWGPEKRPVAMPTAFVYRFGARHSGDLADVARWIREARQAVAGLENTYAIGEIRAGHKVPFQQVVTILNLFREAGQERVEFFGTWIPTQELRQQPHLPYPLRNDATR